MAPAIIDKPIVIMGTGIPAVCAIINRRVDIAYNAPDTGPAVNVFVLDTKDQPRPYEGATYPLNDMSTDAMHPFRTAKLPAGFPPFGGYARETALEDAGWIASVMGGAAEFIVPIAGKYVWDRCHHIGRLCEGMALDADA